MGCGFGAAHSRKKPRVPTEGRISKEDFVVRRSVAFSSEYSLERCLGNGTTFPFMCPPLPNCNPHKRNVCRSMGSKE